jgi:hypothetical protein
LPQKEYPTTTQGDDPACAQRIVVERGQFHRRQRPIGRHDGVQPRHRHRHIDRKDGAILANRLRDPIFGRPGVDEIERQTSMAGLK